MNIIVCNNPRRGVSAILFALMLPVLVILAMIAINLCYMQLVRTELKIATDVATRAGSLAYNELGDLAAARNMANQAAGLNDVGGVAPSLGVTEADGDIVFGTTTRIGSGRFDFTPVEDEDIVDDGVVPTGVKVNMEFNSMLAFSLAGRSSFTPKESSIASNVERDIALIFDRSGSMAYFDGNAANQGEDYLFNTITSLYNGGTGFTEAEYHAAVADYQGDPFFESMSLNSRGYSPTVLALIPLELQVYGSSFNTDYLNRIDGPLNSKWHRLRQANVSFFSALQQSGRQSQLSVCSFGETASTDLALTNNLTLAQTMLGTKFPEGGTAMGDAMVLGAQTLQGPTARISAVKTMILFSDGVNNRGVDPRTAKTQVLTSVPGIVIHTVSFGDMADQPLMQEIAADSNGGKHFHAENGLELVEIFRYLASCHPTVVTE